MQTPGNRRGRRRGPLAMQGLARSAWAGAACAVLAGAAGWLAAPPAAQAQLVPGQSAFLRPATSPDQIFGGGGLLRSLDPDIRRGVTVANRPRPEYDPQGLRYGPLVVRPLVRVDTIYDDNILASGTRKESDFYVQTVAAAGLRTDWSTHELGLSGEVTDRRFAEFTTENSTGWRLNANGRYDIGRFQFIDARVSAARIFIPRDDAEDFGSVSPVAADERLAQLGYSVRENRLGLRVQGLYQSLRFEETEIVNSTGQIVPFDQSFRNRDLFLGVAGLSYEIAPLRSAVVIARANRRSYVDEASNAGQAGGPLARSSNGYDLLAGVDFDYNGIWGVRALVGWLQQFYEDDRLPNVSAPTYELALVWNPTTLTSLRVFSDRQVTESIRTNNSAILRTNFGAALDHELARNVLLNFGVGYRVEDYQGISRQDETLVGTLGATYLVNRNLRLGATYTREEGDRSGTSADFGRNIFLLRLTAAL